MNEIYFENVTNIGNLYLEKVFNEFEGENITFICKDTNDTRYFCICYEFRNALKWIMCKITPEIIGKLIIGKIDIKGVFDIERKNLIQISYMNGKEISKKITMFDIEESVFPRYGIYLKPEQDMSKYLYYICYNYIKTSLNTYENFLKYRLNEVNNTINNVHRFTKRNKNMIISYNLTDVTKNKNKELCFIKLDEAA